MSSSFTITAQCIVMFIDNYLGGLVIYIYMIIIEGECLSMATPLPFPHIYTVGSQIYAINLFMRNAIFQFFAKIKFAN